MKKLLSTAAVLSLAAGVAHAQPTSSDVISVGSNVTQECQANAVSTGVNITYAFDQQVAELTIECNVSGEINLNFSSDGTAELVNASAPSADAIPYTLDVERTFFTVFLGIEPTILDNAALPFDYQLDNTMGDFITPQAFDVRLNVDSADVGTIFAGSYTDEIDVVLTMN